MSDVTRRLPCVSIGWGGSYQIDGDPHVAHMIWLPKGYGPSVDMFTICLVRLPPDEGVDYMQSNHPLLISIKNAIESYMRSTARAA